MSALNESSGLRYDNTRSHALAYDALGRPDAPAPYTRLAAREFRYDSARGRYLHRKLNPATLLPDSSEAMHWTDYLGDEPWGDFDSPVGSSTPTDITRYFPGMGTQGKQNASTSAVSYFHGDLIDSTVLSTTGAGATGGTTIYTAFGEIVGTPGADAGRYQYAGCWGYESGLISLSGANAALPAITLQHVGWRWYQPSIGRFIQRDPIGLLGGINTYVYCHNNPLISVDPHGLLDFWNGVVGAVAGAVSGALTGGGVGAIGGGIGGFIAGGLEDDTELAAAQGFIAGIGGGLTVTIAGKVTAVGWKLAVGIADIWHRGSWRICWR